MMVMHDKMVRWVRLQIENSWLDLGQRKALSLTASIGGILAAQGENEEEGKKRVKI